MRLKCAFKSQYKNGFQKLLLIAVHVTKKSKNGGTCNIHHTNTQNQQIIIQLSLLPIIIIIIRWTLNILKMNFQCYKKEEY